jgi:two-component system cell cycle response regulator
VMGALALLLLGYAIFSLRSSHAHLRAEAMTDSLTGLGNRRILLADLEAGLAAASTERPLLLAIFDLNGFKSYNDTFGHPAGDALLIRLAENLQSSLEGLAVPYRLGGDEFCVLATLERDPADTVVATAERALSEHGEGFAVTCSHGSILLPDEADNAGEALRLADQRMYADKKAGRLSAGEQMTDVLLKVLAERSADLGEHLGVVAELTGLVGRELGLSSDEVATIVQAAALHDVGKVAVPDAILDKPGPLDAHEWEFIRQHTLIGERILSTAPALSAAAQLVRASHERIDGSGYPDGLAGAEIPLGARIICVCDAFDAMTCARPYRTTPLSVEGAIAELRGGAGSQFDPRVVEAFCSVIEARGGAGLGSAESVRA